MHSSPRKYDFFISRSGDDAAIAIEVADALGSAGHSVRYQDEDIPVGSNFIERMSALVEDCRNLIVILSPAYLDSPYCREEWTNFLADLFAEEAGRRVVVLVAEECRPPGILRARVFGSLAGVSDPARRRQTIIAAAEGHASRIPVEPSIFEGVPPRDPDFFGREAELGAIRALCARQDGAAGRPTRTVAITGPGAVGTSFVVAEYAHRNAGHYWGVWWLRADTRPALVSGLADLGRRIEPRLLAQPPAPGADLEPAARAALSTLKQAPLPWLLIYDNTANPEVLADLLPPGNAHVLIVSRWPDWHGLADEVEIDVFAPDEAARFLCQRAGSDDTPGAARLAEALGCLPLALEQAGALCRRAGLSFDDYAARMPEFIRMAPTGGGNRRSLLATFGAAIDEAAGRFAPAEKLMGLFAYLASDGIPVSIVDQEIMDVLERTAAFEALTSVSLLSINNRRVRLNRLMQEVMRQRVREKQQFDGLRPLLHTMLRKLARETTAETPAVLESALATVHHDPAPAAELRLTHTHDRETVIEVVFTKVPEGVFRVFEVGDGGRPFHRIETLYYLSDGWKAKEVANRTF